MSDVYAGDSNPRPGKPCPPITDVFQFVAVADAEPDALLRFASQLLLTNTVPIRVHMTRATPDTLLIEAELRGISHSTAESIRRKLLQLSCIESVQVRLK